MSKNFTSFEIFDNKDGCNFSNRELNTIERLGLSVDDLKKILGEKPYNESNHAIFFELPINGDEKNLAKVWKYPKRDKNRFQNESITLRLLRLKKTTIAPEILGSLKSSTILFEENIKGVNVEHFDKNNINKLADSISTFHSMEFNSYGKPFSKRKKGDKLDCLNHEINILNNSIELLQNSDSLNIINSIKNVILKSKKKAEENRDDFKDNSFTLIHFDLNQNNILKSLDSNKIIIIDWEQATAGDNAMDIAKMFMKLNFNENQRTQFISRYKYNLPSEYGLESRIKAYNPLVIANSILWRINTLKYFLNHKPTNYELKFLKRVESGLEKEIKKLKNFENN